MKFIKANNNYTNLNFCKAFNIIPLGDGSKIVLRYVTSNSFEVREILIFEIKDFSKFSTSEKKEKVENYIGKAEKLVQLFLQRDVNILNLPYDLNSDVEEFGKGKIIL